MLTLLPVALLLLSAVAIQVVGRVIKRPGSTWFLASVLVGITWLCMILIGIFRPVSLIVDNWLPEPFPFAGLRFEVTNETWVFGFLLVSLLQAVIFFNARMLDSQGYITRITGSIVLSSFGLLSVFARTPLAFIVTWSLIDLAEFGVLVATIGNVREHRSIFTKVLFRELGIILLVLLLSISPEMNLDPSGSGENTAWLLLIIVVLRLGILPLTRSSTNSYKFNRGVETLLQAIPFLTAFSFITTTAVFSGTDQLLPWQIVILSIAMLYGSFSWFFSRDELGGRSFWYFSLGCLGCFALLTAQTDSLPGLSMLAVSTGAGVFLHSPRFKKVIVYLPVLLAGVVMLPFSPTMSLPSLFSAEKYIFFQVLGILSYGVLIAGVVRHTVTENDEFQFKEPWMRLFHVFSLYFIAVVPWMIMGIQAAQIKLQVNWWVTVSVLVVAAAFTSAFLFLLKHPISMKPSISNVLNVTGKVIHVLDQLFRMNWLSKLLSSIGFVINRLASMLIRIQEGDGGLLWSFLFIILLLSLLITRQVP